MTTQQAASQGFPTVRPATLPRLAAFDGPCLTIALPGRHPGSPEPSRRVQAKGVLDTVLAGQPAAWATKARQSAEDFLTNSVAEGGAPGLVLVANDHAVECFQAPVNQAHAAAGPHPHILPLLEAAATAQDLWILALSTKHVKLFEYADGIAAGVSLPSTVPANLDAAGHFHTGGVPTQGRTAGGPVGVTFGYSGERESARDSVEHFCAMIDHGLHATLAGRPLLLMGVKEEIAAYRRVSHYDSLLHAEVDGNVENLTPTQIATLAQNAARDEYRRAGLGVLAEFRELRDRTRVSDDPHAILEAAAAGRIHKVCLRAGTELQSPQGDVLNAIAVETIRKGGTAYLLPQEEMPVTQAACAILRY